MEKKVKNKIWGCLLHLSFNMWEEYIWEGRPFRGYRPELELDQKMWDDAISTMSEEGCNLVVIDLGDAVRYESHPEIAVKKAWSVERLYKELERMRGLGLEPIPKLNFSAGHDTWMGDYSRMVSTDEYYQFCTEIINEVSSIFGHPRFFHLGMDEESSSHQQHNKVVVQRLNDAWWKDFLFLNDAVEKNGSRSWIWPDYMLWNSQEIKNKPDQFFQKMPKSVVQGNWYYKEVFNEEDTAVKAYRELNANGYDQIPTGSYHNYNTDSIGATVAFGKKNISDSHLLGFLQTFWRPTIEENRDRIIGGIKLLGEAKRKYYK